MRYLGGEIRCALCRASISSLAKNASPALIAALVEQNRWSAARGLAYARLIPGPGSRARALAYLGSRVSDPLLRQNVLQEALAPARTEPYLNDRTEVLTVLSRQMPGPLSEQLLGEALDTARAIDSSWSRAEALSTVSVHLADPLKTQVLHEALAAAETVSIPEIQAKALVAVGLQLAEPLKRNVLRFAIAQVMRGNAFSQAEVFASIAGQTVDAPRDEALEAALVRARSVEDDRMRAETLAVVAVQFPEPLKQERLSEALAVLGDVWPASARVAALDTLAPHLSGSLLQEAEDFALATGDEEVRAEILIDVTANLHEPIKGAVLRDALQLARTVKEPWRRYKLFVRLAPRLPDSLKQDALDGALSAARSLSGGSRAEALASLADQLPELLRGDVLDEAFAEAIAVPGRTNINAQTLATVAEVLPEPLKRRALNEVIEIARGYQCDTKAELLTWAAAGLPSPLREELLEEALVAARSSFEPGKRVHPFFAVRGLAVVAHTSGNTLSCRSCRRPCQPCVVSRTIEHEPMRLHLWLQSFPRICMKSRWHWHRTWGGGGSRQGVGRCGRAFAPGAHPAGRADGPGDRRRGGANAGAPLAAHLPEDVVRETMERARQTPQSWSPATIVPLATRLATLGHAEEAMAMVTQVVTQDRHWANALTELSSMLVKLPAPVLYPIWRDALRRLALAGREPLLRVWGG